MSEYEEAKQRVTVKERLIGNGDTVEKIKMEVEHQLTKGKIDYGALWRDKVVPALFVWGSIAIASTILAFIGWLVVFYLGAK